MLRSLSLTVLGLGCAHEVSRPNPPQPPAPRSSPYSGRIVVTSEALREQVSGFESAWTRRLGILGIPAHITYDDARAVIDVYGVGPEQLDRLAGILSDPGGWWLDGHELDGSLLVWLPSTPDCHCSGRARVAIVPEMLCQMHSGGHTLSRMGGAYSLQGKIFWRTAVTATYTDIAPSVERCPDKDVWPDNIVFELPLGAPQDADTALVLALAGGSLPDAPRIASVTRGSGAP